ncbi:MAG: phosphomethylpyrimidine synthase ThiC [Candidatus Thermoplasmatota archaeon]|nr:phosphomethylpyrimidine synthase ThiC [Candidatus Thermoplasmatota archaeon]MBS3790681.1 phosphomethylpyrimidine synthase ThiC [Candidatus Thermoplasmatota archaeon]
MTLPKECEGGIPEIVRSAAQKEPISAEQLARLVEKGKAVIPYNPRHDPEPTAIGEGLKTKINVNIGTSKDHSDINEEIKKMEIAEKYGTDTVMDLSTGGDIDKIRNRLIENTDLPFGTVPIYQCGLTLARESAIVDMSSDDIFNGIRKHAEDGVDFITVHCGVTKKAVESLKQSGRLTNVISRGGSFLTAWILHNEEENPLYSEFDYLLEMAKEYNLTLSLGDGFRPGSISDATDIPQVQELITLGELVSRSREKGIQAMVEGPGHVPIDQVETNVKMQKEICDGAPFYVLGPLVTDFAPGYDHIVGAIGGALAGYKGADFLCYVTPAEHLGLPDVQDVKEGVIASKIAAHAADLANGIDREIDDEISQARQKLDWEKTLDKVVDPEKAKRYREEKNPTEEEACSMCGDVCAIKMVDKYLK